MMKIHFMVLVAWMGGVSVHAQSAPAEPAPPSGTAEADPFKEDGAPWPPRDVSVRYEVFSVDPAKAASMRRGKPDDGKFYETLVGLLPSGEVVQEEFAMVRCPSGERVRMQSAREHIYPTEANMMECLFTPPPANPPKPVVSAVPAAFERRTAGLSVEMTAMLDGGGEEVTLGLVPVHEDLTGRMDWAGKVETPLFEARRLDVTVTVRMGAPCFLGTVSPPPDTKLAGNRIWFAFATARISSK